MPWPTAAGMWVGQSLLFTAVVMGARRVVSHWSGGWTVIAYPLMWIAIDTLSATLLPDGNWGSPAYTQAGALPVLQLAALGGTAGILFPLSLLPSAIAWWLLAPTTVRFRPVVVSLLVMSAAFTYGHWRLQTIDAAEPSVLRVGLAAIDDPIGAQASPSYWQPIRDGYDTHVHQLAQDGAQIVLLPEKIAVRTRSEAEQWRKHFSGLAAAQGVWLSVGMGIDGARPENRQWLFNPLGDLVRDYEKQFLAPGERAQGYSHGDQLQLAIIEGQRFGLAICKDMHFAELGRRYGNQRTSVMLVPAWDFSYLDAWLVERMSATRGVENGYALVRASREGMLSVSDSYGRLLGKKASSSLPGVNLLVELPVQLPLDTIYLRFGLAFSWLCTCLAFLLLLGAQRRPVEVIRNPA